jgi:hypothetical protein
VHDEQKEKEGMFITDNIAIHALNIKPSLFRETAFMISASSNTPAEKMELLFAGDTRIIPTLRA